MPRNDAIEALLNQPRRPKSTTRAKKPPAPKEIAPQAPPTNPVRDGLLAEGVPASLADDLLARYLTRPALQRALTHWTGVCHLTGLVLSDSADMLRPVMRPDGRFVCRAAATLAGDLSDAALVQVCSLVVQNARANPAPPQPVQAPPAHHQPAHQQVPSTPLHYEEIPDAQEPFVGLHDQDGRPEVGDWSLDATEPAVPGFGRGPGVDDAIDKWLSRFDAGESVPARVGG